MVPQDRILSAFGQGGNNSPGIPYDFKQKITIPLNHSLLAAGPSLPFVALARHVHVASVPAHMNLPTPTWQSQVFIQAATADSSCMEDFHRRRIFCLPAFTCSSYQSLKRNASRSTDHLNKHKCYLTSLASSSLSLQYLTSDTFLCC